MRLYLVSRHFFCQEVFWGNSRIPSAMCIPWMMFRFIGDYFSQEEDQLFPLSSHVPSIMHLKMRERIFSSKKSQKYKL